MLYAKVTNEEIGRDEYNAYMDERGAAQAELRIIKYIEGQAAYLRQIEEDTGVRGWIFSDVGITRILGRNINIFLFAAVVIVFARTYSVDFAGKVSAGDFNAVLRTTVRGRRASLVSKLWATLCISLALALVFTGVDVIIGISVTGRFFDLLSAPIASIQGYGDMGGITIGAYLALVAVLRCAGYVILAYLTVSASYVVKKVPATLFLVSVFTLLPYALVYMGVLSLRYIDFTAMLAGGKLLKRSAAYGVAGGTFTFALLLAGGYAALTTAALLCLRRNTGK